MKLAKIAIFAAMAGILLSLANASDLFGQGYKRKQGSGRQKNEPAFQADKELFHYLLAHRKSIRRTVKKMPNGVQTITESDVPEIAAKIHEHVTSMHQRVKNGRPIHLRDPLFAAIFSNADKIKMRIEKTPKGVMVTETSQYPYVARLIQAHAEVVSLFLKNGHYEVRKNHSLPAK